MNTKSFNIGQKVICIDDIMHNDIPECYPPIGTTGIIESIDEFDGYWVKWTDGTTSIDDLWHIPSAHIDEVLED